MNVILYLFTILGVTDETAQDLARKLGLENRMEETVDVIKSLYNAFITNDASLIEINPYAEDTYGKSKYHTDNIKFLIHSTTL